MRVDQIRVDQIRVDQKKVDQIRTLTSLAIVRSGET